MPTTRLNTKFKKDFVVMNQKSRQTVTTSVENQFYELLNNSNFGIDCRYNIGKCTLKPIYDDFSEIAYIKKYTTIFTAETLRDFFSPSILKQEINQKHDAKIFTLNKEDSIYEARKKYFERKREEELDAVNTFEKNKKVRKRKFQSIEEKIYDCQDPRKTKMIIEFNDGESDSVKSFAVKKKNVI